MSAIQITQLDAVEGHPGVMDREFQLPGRLVDVHRTRACLGNAHRPPSFPGTPSRGCRCCHPGSPPDRMHSCSAASRHATYHKTSSPTARGSARMPEFTPTELLPLGDRKSTRLNSSHPSISYAVFCLKKKNNNTPP